MNYRTVIGLEVHVELSTQAKAFCRCSTRFGAPPNTLVCPVCLGLPGALPVPNKQAIEYSVMAGLALNCDIAEYSRFDRKNYFYPDLAKGYQISQYKYPVAVNGYMDVPDGDDCHRVRITRAHLEEDTGKLMHTDDATSIDFNRSGVPLLEIVSEPDITSPEQARVYLQELKTTLSYTGVSDLKMEEGSLRCDANVSLQAKDSDTPGTLVEIKNMNSFRSVKMALEYEVQRQTELLTSGEKIVRETRHWDEQRSITFSSRSKEQAHDYRYFPEPDLPPTIVDEQWLASIKANMPTLPFELRSQFVDEFKLPPYDARVLTASPISAQFFCDVVSEYGDPKTVSNWIMGDLMGCMNAMQLDFESVPITSSDLAELLKLIKAGKISGKIAKTVLEEMCQTGKPAADIIASRGLEQISDEDELKQLVRKVIADNPKPAQDFRDGKKKALGFLVGQIMKQTQGKANPQVVNEILTGELSD